MKAIGSAEEYYAEIERRYHEGLLPAWDGEQCYYRKESKRDSNVGCVIGLLIDDEKYSPRLEGLTIEQLLKLEALVLPEWLSLEQAEEVQDIHDNGARCCYAELFILSEIRHVLGLNKEYPEGSE